MAIETRIKVEKFSDGRVRYIPEIQYTGPVVLGWHKLAGIYYSESEAHAAIELALASKTSSIPVETYYLPHKK